MLTRISKMLSKNKDGRFLAVPVGDSYHSMFCGKFTGRHASKEEAIKQNWVNYFSVFGWDVDVSDIDNIVIMANGLAHAALFTESDVQTNPRLTNASLLSAVLHVVEFVSKNKNNLNDLLSMVNNKDETLFRIGTDIWYALGSHGAGFFDKEYHGDNIEKIHAIIDEFDKHEVQTITVEQYRGWIHF